jgi:hypothetical protein
MNLLISAKKNPDWSYIYFYFLSTPFHFCVLFFYFLSPFFCLVFYCPSFVSPSFSPLFFSLFFGSCEFHLYPTLTWLGLKGLVVVVWSYILLEVLCFSTDVKFALLNECKPYQGPAMFNSGFKQTSTCGTKKCLYYTSYFILVY